MTLTTWSADQSSGIQTGAHTKIAQPQQQEGIARVSQREQQDDRHGPIETPAKVPHGDRGPIRPV